MTIWGGSVSIKWIEWGEEMCMLKWRVGSKEKVREEGWKEEEEKFKTRSEKEREEKHQESAYVCDGYVNIISVQVWILLWSTTEGNQWFQFRLRLK